MSKQTIDWVGPSPVSILIALALGAAACSSSDSATSTDGGASSGGSSSGGAATGGSISNGGSVSSGGHNATGGNAAGGTAGRGGTGGSGGNEPDSGHMEAGALEGGPDARGHASYACDGAPPADAGIDAGPPVEAGARSATCVVGESYCHIQISNLPGSRGGTYGTCTALAAAKPECRRNFTCACILPHPDVVCSCAEKNGEVTVTCGPV